MKYLIKSEKVKIGKGAISACGPIPGPVIGEVAVELENGTMNYICLVEAAGFPNFYKNTQSDFDIHCKSVISEEEFAYINETYLDADYLTDYDIFFEGGKTDELYEVYRYLIYIVRSSWEDTDAFAEATVGKYIDEIDIPATDVEIEHEE